MKIAVAFVLVLLVVSCQFTPHGEFKKEISPNSNIPPVKIDFNNAPDTVLMFGPIEFQYAVTGVDLTRPYTVSVTTAPSGSENIRGIDVNNQLTGSFTVQPLSPFGFYILTMTVTQLTRSGSLADHMDLETMVFKKSIVLHSDVDPPDDYAVDFNVENGSLKVSWPKYDRINFHSYHLKKKYIDSTGNPGAQKTAEYDIVDANKNFLIDSTFVGGTVSYSIAVTTVTLPNNHSENYRSYTEAVSPIVKYESLPGGKVKAYWRKSPYYSNFYKYYFGRYGGVTFKTTNVLTDTTAIFAPAFGGTDRLAVRTSSHGSAVFTEGTYTLTDPHPIRFDALLRFGSTTGMAYYTLNGYVHRYDLTTETKKDSVFAGYFAPLSNQYNGQFAVSPSGNSVWIYRDFVMFKVDPMTLETISSFSLLTLPGFNTSSHIHSFAVSDQNTLAVQDVGLNATTLSVFDLATLNPVATLNNNFVSYLDMLLSSDGQYITGTYPPSLIQVTPGTATVINAAGAVVIDAGNPNHAVQYNGGFQEFQILELSTQTVIEHYAIPAAYLGFRVMLIDPVTHWVAITNNNSELIIVYDFVNGVEKFRAPFFSSPLTFYNGTLFSSQGARLKLN